MKLDVLPVAVDRAALQPARRARFNSQIRRLGNRDAGAVWRVSPCVISNVDLVSKASASILRRKVFSRRSPA
ncbi:MAG: hypothetical protein CR217_06800 [Beijerinckiaceae bacterium]|nr:MAG: hypothetical protein CR217_06800 [Beijerinckiaceae bacterium]